MQDIRNLTIKELTDFLVQNNEKPFRAKQIYEWLWKKHIKTFAEMTSISQSTRELLEQNFSMNTLKVVARQKSTDGTIKVAFQLRNEKRIEGVIIPSDSRVTACISTQYGCALACRFCATGKIKSGKNLFVYEIFEQVLCLKEIALEEYKLPLSNIVIMGMGEPLLNYDNVMLAIEKMTTDEGLAMSPQRITLSTSGITEGIRRLADDNIKFNLAISLHTANSAKRDNLMPVNKSNSLEKLSDSIAYFHRKTGTRITYEYLLLKDFNDSLNDAKELAEFCKVAPCKINLIEYNQTEDSPFQKSFSTKVNQFKDFLDSKNLIVNLRQSKGQDIDAACGQLANKSSK